MKFGIDVSSCQGEFDWDSLENVDFAIIRIGNTKGEKDSQFERNYKECKRLGIQVGCYIYSYTDNIEEIDEACKFILNNIQEKEFELPIFLDLEDNSISYLSKEEQTTLALEFCNYIEENSDCKAGVYANLNWFENHINKEILTNYEVPLWIAHFGVDPNKYENSEYMILQFTTNGGILDEDVLYEKTDSDEIIGSDDLSVPYRYQNGSTFEDVYSDTESLNKIGYLNKYENVPCLGVYKNRAIVLYKVDNSENYKIGFCKWLGGVKK